MSKKKAVRLYSNGSFNKKVENIFSLSDAYKSELFKRQRSASNKWQKKRVKRINEFKEKNPEMADYIKTRLEN